jgi:hypothetical protein
MRRSPSTHQAPRVCPICDSPLCNDCREPYVGEGADGARRSAQMDREEAATLPEANMGRRTRLLISADRWEWQAARLEKSQS